VGDSTPTTNTTTSLPSIFHYDGTNWDLLPAPKFQDFPHTQSQYDLLSVSFGPPGNPVSRDDGWAVGLNATADAVAIHWDGVTWSPQLAGLTGPYAGPLYSVFMLGSSDVWAVGEDTGGTVGTVWHWTGVAGLGGGWSLVQTVPEVLYSVYMVNATEGWAVGASGSIFHYFAGGWTPFASPINTQLNSVFMLSPTEGWAVGNNGMILHYVAGTWSGPVSPGTTSSTLFSIFLMSSTEGWAVGGSGAQAGATILQYSGGTWTSVPTNLIPLSPVNSFSVNSVFFETPTDGWAVGTAGVIIHFDGTNWGSVTSPTIDNFTSINFGPPLSSQIDPNDGWAVGNASSSGEPTIFHWNGFVWTKGVAIGTTNNLNSVFMVNGGDVWAVGGGTNPTASCSAATRLCPVILHFTGGSWNTVTPPPGFYRLNSVFMVSPNEGWAVGVGAGDVGMILHYTVTGGVGSWAIYPAPSSPSTVPSLNSIFMLDQDEGWIVGDNGTILHYTVSGGVGTWDQVAISGTPTLSSDVNLTSIFMLSPSSGWAVGGIQAKGAFSAGPVIAYWNGMEWSPVAVPSIPGGISATGHTSALLKTVFCSSGDNCWAAGFPGKQFATLLHWDGVEWSDVTTTPALLGVIPPILTSIYLIDNNTSWIVGGDPDFDSNPTYFPGGVIQPGGAALSTILRYQCQIVETITSTEVALSTSSATTSYLTTSSWALTNVTRSTPLITPTAPNIVPVVLVVLILLVILIPIFLILARRNRRPPVVYYPYPRRPP